MTRADIIRKTFDDCRTDAQIAMDMYETVDDCEVCPINGFCRSKEHLFSRECCTEVILAYLQEEVSEAGEQTSKGYAIKGIAYSYLKVADIVQYSENVSGETNC